MRTRQSTSWKARGFSSDYSTCLLEWRAVYRSGPDVCGLCPAALKKIREDEMYTSYFEIASGHFSFSVAGFLVNYYVFQLTSTPEKDLMVQNLFFFILPRFLNRNFIWLTYRAIIYFFLFFTRISKKICAIGVTRPRPCSTATLRLTITTWNRLSWPAATQLGNEAKWTNLDLKTYTSIDSFLFRFCLQVPEWQ